MSLSVPVETTPYNLQKQDASAAAVETAVAYALSVVDNYATWLVGQAPRLAPGVPRSWRNQRVMDLGPGPTLGAAVLMACAGAHVTVADKYLVGWDSDFHPHFYGLLLRRLRHCSAEYREPVRRLLEARSFDTAIVSIPESAETLDRTSMHWDIVFSNAVLEHVTDINAATQSLFHITSPGGLGFHQIDFRDHRNFEDPLRYLTIDRDTFAAINPTGNFGTRARLAEYVACFTAAGFTVLGVHPSDHVSPSYLQSLRPHLVAEFASRPDAELSVVGALVCVQRPENGVEPAGL